MDTSRRAAVYSRSARRDDQARTRQLDACREWAAEHGMKVVAEVTDESPGTETGANLLAALEAEDREWPVLLVTEQNRLARDSQVRLSILSRAETLGIEVVAVRR